MLLCWNVNNFWRGLSGTKYWNHSPWCLWSSQWRDLCLLYKLLWEVHIVQLLNHATCTLYSQEKYICMFCQKKLCIFPLRRAQKQNMLTHTDTHWIDSVKARPLASRTPVSVPMFRGEYAAGPLLCFSPQSLSYLEVHCCHKAESREKHCRAWRSSITGTQTQTVATTSIEVHATKDAAITNI